MAYRALPPYARKARTPESHMPSPTWSVSRNILIGADEQGAIIGACLRHMFLIYEHYKLQQEQVRAVSELFVPRKEPRYEVEVMSSAQDEFTVKVQIIDGVVSEYGREALLG